MRLTPEESAQTARQTAFDDDLAAERGRLMACRNLIEDPECRKRMEDQWGKAYLKIRYPEAYSAEVYKDVIKFIPTMGDPGL